MPKYVSPGGGSGITTAQAVAAVEAAPTVNPAGQWDFDSAPTVNGAAIGGGSGGGGVSDHGALSGLGDDDHSQYALADGSRGAFAATSHTHPAAQISDATATGRAVLTAASQAAARTAIGAGTSNLAIGTTASTAKAGNYQPTAANISDSTTVGRAVLTAADAAAARAAIGVGAPVLVLAAGAPVPGGTAAGTVILRTA